MTFEEWWDKIGHAMLGDTEYLSLSDVVKAAWEVAFEEGRKPSNDETLEST